MKKMVVLPKVKGNGHGGFFVGRKGHLKLKHVVEGNTIYRPKIGIETHCQRPSYFLQQVCGVCFD